MEITWTNEAETWLKEIFDFISKDNEKIAPEVIAGIYERAQILEEHPRIGYKYRDEPEGEIRILLYGHYRIAYLLGEQNIIILGVFHGALDIDRYISVQS
ncbi:plasmid stabilization protein [Aliifodinibius salipaludis]|uniref:Plasmid stabilization protein n=1 Tax=Fodinibius salipaludis TaxID=2032627 RepID=A0A2A2G5Z5_9BACT|nr:type II toxin-antitoxin system RelE/ParE family toxin [Aliifodinibius salipaludis]PAU93186.1 plasmid stabilization protein [Aliifodinibius salipaludis]